MTTTPFAPDATALFMVRQTGNIGQEIISPRGKVIAWTVDPVIGNLFCRILNQYTLAPDSVAALIGEEGGK